MILDYFLVCYGFTNSVKNSRVFSFFFATDILCGVPFDSFSILSLWISSCSPGYRVSLSRWKAWGCRAHWSYALIWSLIWPLRENVWRLEDTVCSLAACRRALKPEFSFTHPPGLVDHCPGSGLCGRVRTRCCGGSPPHSPLPWKQASPYCAYCYPQITCIPKSRAQ